MGNIVNSQDVLNNPSDPTQWYELRIVNNIIVNNVAANGGAGIFLQDVARATVINNTVANNDSTSTSALAFTPGQLDSNPLPAGVVSGAHSAALQALFGAGFEQTFSNPTLVNNIIWQNRSWYNDGTTTPGVGILSPNPAGLYQDLGVVFTLTPQLLNPMYCVLTDTAGYDVSNLAPADPGFVLSYLNTLSTATVLDEGGNAINVSYPELNAALGNYHLNVGAAAMDNGAPVNIVSYPQLALDFDRQTRPSGSAVDIGADELGLTALATLAPNIPSPQSAGTSIGFSATASGGLGTFEYQFRLRTPAGVWSVPQAYSATSNWTWNTTGLATGTYRVVVWVRNAGSAAAYEAFAFVDFVLVQPATGATLTPNPVSPQIPGTSVEFTATGLGGSGTFEYQFRLRTPAGVWSVSQPYSATPTWTWNTTGLATGTYRLVVWVRNAGSAATYQAFASVDYLLAPPATGATLTPNPLSPQLPGASVDFAATGSGGLGTYEYQFRLRTPAGVWSVSQPYSATPTWTWNTTGLATGTYRLVVWVRNAGSSATYEAFSFQDYVLQ
jgi:parallel beta-helix repeat protein